MSPPSKPAARPAATIILCRPVRDGTGFEVLLVKRHGKSGFMPGAHVFPGGRVEETDSGVSPELGARVVPQLAPTDAARFLAAAVRETREEAGIDVDPATLVAWAHWITPVVEPKRFDTWFFLAPVAAATEARIDEHEAVAFAWYTPRDALATYGSGQLVLAPPTLATLEDLAPFSTFEDAAGAVRRPLPPICPVIHAADGGMILALPGDPLHDERARAFETRTRFTLDGGRFVSG